MAGLPPEEEPNHKRLLIRTFYIAIAALAISVGHVVYAFFRDHVFD